MSLNKFFTKATHPETENHLWQTKLLPWSQCPPPGRQSAWVQSWTCWRKCRSMSQISQMIPHVIYPIHAKKDNRNYKDQRSVKRGSGPTFRKKPTNWDQHDRNAVFAARIFSCPVRLDFSFICSGCAWKRDEKSVGRNGAVEISRKMMINHLALGLGISRQNRRQIDLKVLKLASKSSANASKLETMSSGTMWHYPPKKRPRF